MSRAPERLALFLGCCVFLCPAAWAQDIRTRPMTVGVKAGLVTPGVLYLENGVYRDYDGEIGLSLGGHLDYLLGPSISGGVYGDLGTLYTEATEDNYVDLGVTLKALVGGQTGGSFFRPGIALGGGFLTESGSVHFIMKFAVELVIPQKAGRAYLVEAAIGGCPIGGNDDYYITWGPMLMLRAGMAF